MLSVPTKHAKSPRSYDLPEDLFQPGEIRPTRPKKRVVKKTSQFTPEMAMADDAQSKKRSFEQSEIEVSLAAFSKVR